MAAEMKVKLLKKFRNPKTNCHEKIGKELTVPCDQFWLRRVKQEDCEKIEKFIILKDQPKEYPKPKNDSKKTNDKGSTKS